MLPGDLNDETWWNGFDSIKSVAIEPAFRHVIAAPNFLPTYWNLRRRRRRTVSSQSPKKYRGKRLLLACIALK